MTNRILRSINSRNKLYKKLRKTKIDSLSYITKILILTDIELH